MDYEHVTVVLEEGTVQGIEGALRPGQTVEDWVEQAVADTYGDGRTVDDPGRS